MEIGISSLRDFQKRLENIYQTTIKKNIAKAFLAIRQAFLSMITSKGIVNVLIEVANLRNKWKGHGGITSEEENNQRVLTLEQQLNEFRKHIF